VRGDGLTVAGPADAMEALMGKDVLVTRPIGKASCASQ
jgi:hypothetical protein